MHFDHLRELLVLGELLTEASHMCAAYVSCMKAELLDHLREFFVLAEKLNEASLTCTAYEADRPIVTLLRFALLRSSTNRPQPLEAYLTIDTQSLLRFALLRSSFGLCSIGKEAFWLIKPKLGLARGSLLARHLINEVPRCGARKVALQAKLPEKLLATLVAPLVTP